MNTDYLTDEDRERLRLDARTYATAAGWDRALAEQYEAYHVTANEMTRLSVSTTSDSFRIVKDLRPHWRCPICGDVVRCEHYAYEDGYGRN